MPKKYQKPLKNHVRISKTLWSSPKLKSALEDAARECGVSESFVICVALADFLKVKNQERFF